MKPLSWINRECVVVPVRHLCFEKVRILVTWVSKHKRCPNPWNHFLEWTGECVVVLVRHPLLWEHLKWDYKKILVTWVPSIKGVWTMNHFFVEGPCFMEGVWTHETTIFLNEQGPFFVGGWNVEFYSSMPLIWDWLACLVPSQWSISVQHRSCWLGIDF